MSDRLVVAVAIDNGVLSGTRNRGVDAKWCAWVETCNRASNRCQRTHRLPTVSVMFRLLKIAVGVILVTALLFGSSFLIWRWNAQVFTGQYQWDGGSDQLSIAFLPTGQESWYTEFHFVSGRTEDTWNGTAKGNLQDGSKLIGTVTWKKRAYDFEAKVENGVIEGTHTRMIGGNRVVTGTFNVSRGTGTFNVSRGTGETTVDG